MNSARVTGTDQGGALHGFAAHQTGLARSGRMTLEYARRPFNTQRRDGVNERPGTLIFGD